MGIGRNCLKDFKIILEMTKYLELKSSDSCTASCILSKLLAVHFHRMGFIVSKCYLCMKNQGRVIDRTSLAINW